MKRVNKRLPVDLNEQERARLMAVASYEGLPSLAATVRWILKEYTREKGFRVRDTDCTNDNYKYHPLPNGWKWRRIAMGEQTVDDSE